MTNSARSAKSLMPKGEEETPPGPLAPAVTGHVTWQRLWRPTQLMTEYWINQLDTLLMICFWTYCTVQCS